MQWGFCLSEGYELFYIDTALTVYFLNSKILCRSTYMIKAVSHCIYTLLKSDVTRRDHVSVVMDAGSRIVNFICDDRYSLRIITLKYTMLKSDVTRRDHVSVVMDAGSRIVNFIRDDTVFA